MSSETNTTAAGRRETSGGPRLPGAVFAALAIPTLMSSLDTSITNSILPTLAHAFDAPFHAVQWVVLAYLLALTTLIVGAGSLGDLLGRRRLLLAGIALFTCASAVCGLATSLGALVAARGVQGLGAASMMALALASAGNAVPRDRTGRVIGLLGSMSAIGTALGPPLGGLLVASVGWRWVFLVNVPIGIVSLALAAMSLPADRSSSRSPAARFDLAGTATLATALATYSLAMTLEGPGSGLRRVLLLLIAILAGGAFVLVESRSPRPLVRLQLLGVRGPGASLAAGVLVATVVMTTLVVGPFYLGRGLGLDAARVGFALAVGPLVVALSGAPAGRAVDRFGATRMTQTGLAGIAAGSLLLWLLPASADVAGYLASIAILTAGYAVFQTANNTAVLKAVPDGQRGVTSGLLSLSRNLGLISGASAMGAVFALGAGTSEIATASAGSIARGMRTTFAVATAITVVALAVMRWGPGRGPAIDRPHGRGPDARPRPRERPSPRLDLSSPCWLPSVLRKSPLR